MKITILTVIFFICAVLIAWIEFELLPHMSTEIKNPGKINYIITSLSLAYLTSYAFYFVVVYLKEYQDKKNSRQFIYDKSMEIVTITKELKSVILQYDPTNFGEFRKEKLNSVFSQIPINNEVIGHNRTYPFTWDKYLKEIVTETRYAIDRIITLLPYVNSSLVKILNKIYESKFCKLHNNIISADQIIMAFPEVPINMSIYTDVIFDHVKLIDELEGYIKKNLKN